MDRLLPCPYFCIFCWTVCANGPAERLGLVPGAARAALPPPGRCTSPSGDTDTSADRSSSPPSVPHFLGGSARLPDRPVWMLQQDSISALTRSCLLSHASPLLRDDCRDRDWDLTRRLFSFVLLPIGYIFVQDHSSARAVGTVGTSLSGGGTRGGELEHGGQGEGKQR